ncbi:MalY/PatB family protein [Amaricoccus solimangrovi]|uniref:cysteine-S-conjugate beta-lyase n=1 Tax=Amaricoccus solimangrovi TaxID=2589815 RepID=A0A501X0Q4_9RHOB|nr:MalY/PatB family protein [Amaricoccus solimangrovi]TPE52506.1 pyridoxal phosphate-dependent aminotransferase [Amaricoccus solimangrovi]
MFDFDKIIDRRGTHCAKWDMMEPIFGVPAEDGIAMWVADMDFRPPVEVIDALRASVEHGVFGYYGDDRAYRAAIQGWMGRRHGWEVDPDWISTVHGLVAGVALCLKAFSEAGDGVILFTPVYHAFARMITANDRVVVESPLVERDGRYEMDLDALAASLTGRERMVIFCSPHNPGGRIWEPAETKALAEFCAAHDLLLVADEIHHDLILPGGRHTVTPLAAPEHRDRMVMLTAPSKTFNLAGGMTGNVIIENPALKERFYKVQAAAGASPNRFGMIMSTAAYAHGDAWCDEVRGYIAGNAEVFDEGIAKIPGARSMKLQATYLAWVDFGALGMAEEEVKARVRGQARVAANDGPTFGTGGEGYLRFNLATPRSRVLDAVGRLREAFADLQ